MFGLILVYGGGMLAYLNLILGIALFIKNKKIHLLALGLIGVLPQLSFINTNFLDVYAYAGFNLLVTVYLIYYTVKKS